MATSMTMITNFLIISSLLAIVATATIHRPLVAPGLSWKFYKKSCPHVESVIRHHLRDVFQKDIGLAAALLRIHFHDCFVQGCDASVLLDGSPSEQTAPPNLSLRPEALQTIEDLRALVQTECGQVVSCADIAALAARDSVYLSGGPYYDIPLGRRDGLHFATLDATNANLPAPTSKAATLISQLATKGFDTTDVVALSGAHTIGRAHCVTFAKRLRPRDPTMDDTLAEELEITCPTTTTFNTTMMDIRTPNKFDNKYYVDLMKRQGLFTSDQDLFMDSTTKGIVVDFAHDQALFFDKFMDVMIRMGQLGVLTGTQGEVRGNCSAVNADNESLSSVGGGGDDTPQEEQFVWY